MIIRAVVIAHLPLRDSVTYLDYSVLSLDCSRGYQTICAGFWEAAVCNHSAGLTDSLAEEVKFLSFEIHITIL